MQAKKFLRLDQTIVAYSYLIYLDSKINSIYKSLNKKDSEIYIDRIQQTIQDQKERALFKWSVEGFEVCSFADASLHGEKNVVGLIQEINPKSYVLKTAYKYSIYF